jgi:hypothetical protein
MKMIKEKMKSRAAANQADRATLQDLRRNPIPPRWLAQLGNGDRHTFVATDRPKIMKSEA